MNAVAVSESRIAIVPDWHERFAAQCILLHPDRYSAERVRQALQVSYPAVCKGA